MAPLDHTLSDEDRQKGREHSLAKREARAELKRAVTTGDLTLSGLLDQGKHGGSDTDAGRIEVGDALLAVKGVGPIHAANALAAAGVEDDAHLNSLTDKEREALVSALGE